MIENCKQEFSSITISARTCQLTFKVKRILQDQLLRETQRNFLSYSTINNNSFVLSSCAIFSQSVLMQNYQNICPAVVTSYITKRKSIYYINAAVVAVVAIITKTVRTVAQS